MNTCRATQTALLHANCAHTHKVSEGRGEKKSDLHPEAVSRQSTVSLATAVSAAQRLDDLYQHGQSQAVGAEARALLLFTVKDTDVRTQKVYGESRHPPTNTQSERTFLSFSLLFFTSSLLPCPLPPPLPPPPPPPPSPPPPAPAPPPWAPPARP